MNSRRYWFRQILRFAVAALAFSAIIAMLTNNLLNAARAGAEGERANSSFEMPKR